MQTSDCDADIENDEISRHSSEQRLNDFDDNNYINNTVNEQPNEDYDFTVNEFLRNDSNQRQARTRRRENNNNNNNHSNNHSNSKKRIGMLSHSAIGVAGNHRSSSLNAHGRLGVSPVRGRNSTNNNNNNTMLAIFLENTTTKEIRKREKKRRTLLRKRASLGKYASDDDDDVDDVDDLEKQKRYREEDEKRTQMLLQRLDRLNRLPKASKFAQTQIELVNKCLEMLKVSLRSSREEDELTKLLSSVSLGK